MARSVGYVFNLLCFGFYTCVLELLQEFTTSLYYYFWTIKLSTLANIITSLGVILYHQREVHKTLLYDHSYKGGSPPYPPPPRYRVSIVMNFNKDARM